VSATADLTTIRPARGRSRGRAPRRRNPGPGRGGAIFVALFLTVLGPAILGPCAAFGNALEARLPTRVEDESPRDYWQFLFLYERTTAAGQSEFIVHPFYGRYSNEEKAYDYQNVLYPIWFSHGTNYWNKWTLLYFFTGDEFYHEDSEEDSDLFLTPLFSLGGGTADKERYVSVFPIYGRLKNKLGYSDIQFFLFPIYANWSHRDYKAHGILWPLIMWGGSRTRDDLRILPFYSHKIHKGKYDRRSALWPFVQWGSEGLDKKEPRHFFFAFPFYGRKWSDQGRLSAHTFLWLPLLGGLFAYGEDTATDALSYNAFFFLYQYARNTDPVNYKHIIFPFWGKYRFGTSDKDDEPYYKELEFISPFYVNLTTRSATLDSDYHMVVPFYWNDRRYFHKSRESEGYLKFWPLFRYISDSAGRREFRSLTLWPFRSDQFDRNWGTLWSLFEWNTYRNGDKYFATLFRLYSRYWNPESRHSRHFLLGFETHSTPEYWSVEFLGGFLGYRRNYPVSNLTGAARSADVDGHILRLLWLDI
jgi:hypothetical protein